MPYFHHVNLLLTRFISIGCQSLPTLLYCPDESSGSNGYLTRGQAAALIVRSIFSAVNGNAEGFQYNNLRRPDMQTTPYFTDVSVDHPAFPYIQKMKELGLTNGCTATTFCPERTFTYGEIAKLAVLARYRRDHPSSIDSYWPSTLPDVDTVTNSYGIGSSPIFPDVPSSDLFYKYIQATYSLMGLNAAPPSTVCPLSGNTGTASQGRQFCENNTITRGWFAVYLVSLVMNAPDPSQLPRGCGVGECSLARLQSPNSPMEVDANSPFPADIHDTCTSQTTVEGALLGLNLFQRFNDPPAVGTFAYASTSFNPAALSPDLLPSYPTPSINSPRLYSTYVVSTLITGTEPGDATTYETGAGQSRPAVLLNPAAFKSPTSQTTEHGVISGCFDVGVPQNQAPTSQPDFVPALMSTSWPQGTRDASAMSTYLEQGQVEPSRPCGGNVTHCTHYSSLITYLPPDTAHPAGQLYGASSTWTVSVQNGAAAPSGDGDLFTNYTTPAILRESGRPIGYTCPVPHVTTAGKNKAVTRDPCDSGTNWLPNADNWYQVHGAHQAAAGTNPGAFVPSSYYLTFVAAGSTQDNVVPVAALSSNYLDTSQPQPVTVSPSTDGVQVNWTGSTRDLSTGSAVYYLNFRIDATAYSVRKGVHLVGFPQIDTWGQNNPNQVFAFVVYDATPVISSISGAVYANVASVLTITGRGFGDNPTICVGASGYTASAPCNGGMAYNPGAPTRNGQGQEVVPVTVNLPNTGGTVPVYVVSNGAGGQAFVGKPLGRQVGVRYSAAMQVAAMLPVPTISAITPFPGAFYTGLSGIKFRIDGSNFGAGQPVLSFGGSGATNLVISGYDSTYVTGSIDMPVTSAPGQYTVTLVPAAGGQSATATITLVSGPRLTQITWGAFQEMKKDSTAPDGWRQDTLASDGTNAISGSTWVDPDGSGTPTVVDPVSYVIGSRPLIDGASVTMAGNATADAILRVTVDPPEFSFPDQHVTFVGGIAMSSAGGFPAPPQCKYPPAKPGALFCEPLKAARRGR